MKKDVMQQKEYQCPLNKWDIYSIDALLGIIPKILQMDHSETIAREKEKQRHVEHIDDCIAIIRKECMSQNHQHDADAFSKRHGIIKLNIIIHRIYIIVQRYEVFLYKLLGSR
jgi:uncharacterized membrane protein